jgi:ribosomal protein L12E/L44/L45/RPP1/RPP2
VVGGLGLAAAASATTIGLVGVSTGFASGFFAFLDNRTRAGFYTVAANDLSTALAKATQTVGTSPTAKEYDAATKALAGTVSQVVNRLETQRSSAAAAAAASQQIQKAQHQGSPGARPHEERQRPRLGRPLAGARGADAHLRPG